MEAGLYPRIVDTGVVDEPQRSGVLLFVDDRVWMPRIVSRPLISGFAVGQPQHHRPGLRLHDRQLWHSDSST
jgi:hypothetical protein